MPLLNRAVEMQTEIAGWRHALHMEPEILFEVHKTAAFVAEKLRAFGCDEVVTGIGRTGVVGVIKGRHGGGPALGLRADTDALPIAEDTGLAHASKIPGRMHACGHDGHTAMLLGAARHLAETRNFRGRVAVIFQPAEEGGGGGLATVKDGLMERFGIESVYGMHNFPGLPVGQFAIRPGPIMAAADVFSIAVQGNGGHAALPHKTVDPIFIAAQIVGALQGIAARNADPLEAMVVSITRFHAGDAYNVIPQSALLAGTARTLKPELRRWPRPIFTAPPRASPRHWAARLSSITNWKWAIPSRSTANARRRSRRAWRATLPGRRMSIRVSLRSWGPRTFPSCWKRGPAPSSSWATATRPIAIIRPTTSMTPRSRLA
jgi:hippurate hydrolase